MGRAVRRIHALGGEAGAGVDGREEVSGAWHVEDVGKIRIEDRLAED